METVLQADRQSRVRRRPSPALDPRATVVGLFAGLAVAAPVVAGAFEVSVLAGLAVVLWVVPAVALAAVVVAHRTLVRS